MGGTLLLAMFCFHLNAGFTAATSSKVCGTPEISSRIVGGIDAADGAWPWQVSLRVDNQHICGGALIANNWVLSAAHCYYRLGYSTSRYTACLGEHQLVSSNSHSACYSVTRIIVHPLYSQAGSPGDILLLKLDSGVAFTSYILPVCLPETSVQFPSGKACWVTGWGNIRSSSAGSVSLPWPKTLQQVMVPIIDQKTCDKFYHIGSGQSSNSPIILSDMICAGDKAGGKDSCQGDSGGPLVCYIDDAWYLAGVVSWGTLCAQPNRPGVYTLVTAYNSWILENAPEVKLGLVNVTSNSDCPTRTRFFSFLLTIVLLFWLIL
ncbi:serine protease 27-like [Lissotriton helveticus]